MRPDLEIPVQAPAAVVLSCLGGSQGDLGVVRTLGRQGVRVLLVSESGGAVGGDAPEGPAAQSRYVAAHHRIAGFDHDEEALATLERLADAHGKTARPVLVPTADPDLGFVTRHRARLERHFALVSPRADLVETCLDKGRFGSWAVAQGLPVPATWHPRGLQDIRDIARKACFPLIVKPVYPPAWSREPLHSLVHGLKALTVSDAVALEETYRRVAAVDPHVVLQDFVPGRDDQLVSLHVYLDAGSRPLAWFTGRKLRTYPVDAGIGCLVESVRLPALAESSLAALQRVGWTGFALLQFKHDPRDGHYKLLEINPRTSSWNLLAAACGVNLPYVAYRDACGLPPAPPPVQREGLRYLYLENDWRAFRDYRRRGELSVWQWLVSMRRVRVAQLLALDDPRPFVTDFAAKLAQAGRAWVGRAVGLTPARRPLSRAPDTPSSVSAQPE